MKISDLKKLKSLELDLPRGSYEFLNLREFCRSKEPTNCSTCGANSVGTIAELDSTINMRVVDICVSFPTTPHLFNLDICSKSYSGKTESGIWFKNQRTAET